MLHDLHLGDPAYWKRYHLKDYLQPKGKDSYQVLLTRSYTVKLKGMNSWIHISHLKGASASDWFIEGTANLKHLKTTLRPGREADDNSGPQLTQESRPGLWDPSYWFNWSYSNVCLPIKIESYSFISSYTFAPVFRMERKFFSKAVTKRIYWDRPFIIQYLSLTFQMFLMLPLTQTNFPLT